ncbi:MAG: ribose-5-phosphate isomerase RpiA [Methanomassiliicoccaceae archaeon]|nr:ribose-5-phosphate isomerase RpiA [Methanomassiliicoccaceae archaeon]
MTVDLKRMAAEKAVDDFVKDGMIVGLGTGSTAYYAIKRVGELVSNGYKLKCVATSVQTEKIARECGIDIVELDDIDHIDVTIDGADEVDPNMQLIKGLGGALLREKIVASVSRQEIIIADDSKLVETLGTKGPLPVEVLKFGYKKTKIALEKQRCTAVLRMKDGKIFITDGGNYIYDCKFDRIDNPFFLESRINVIPGVIDNGLFLNMTTAVVISSPDGKVRMM